MTRDKVTITALAESVDEPLYIDGPRIKTLTGSKEWQISPFRARDRHYVVFVWYPTTTDPRVQPAVYVVASERLRKLLDRKRVKSLPLDLLASELSAEDAWQELAVAPAA